MQLVFFSEELIALQKEAAEHPLLVEHLREHQNADWEVKFACIAAYCEVMVDGNFMPADLDHLAGVLTNKLQAKRGIVVGMEVMKPLILTSPN